mmetsp:Transcript_57966/g.184060  ORF Transcript_57966/g.184060 Transcript_57966/m.184060 type:complete len:213 (-) Transcript_57966:386-1024(-)
MASGSREEWELLCAYRQQARSNDVVDLARKVGGGGMSAAAQDTLLERCIRDPVCVEFPLAPAYVASVTKRAVLAAEQDGEEVTDALVEEQIERMMAAGPAGGGGEGSWHYKTWAYAPPPGGAGAEEERRFAMLTVRTSSNMLEGSTGCHEWQAGFRLAEVVLGHPGLVEGKRCLELGCGTGVLGVILGRSAASGGARCPCPSRGMLPATPRA